MKVGKRHGRICEEEAITRCVHIRSMVKVGKGKNEKATHHSTEDHLLRKEDQL